MGNFFNNFWDTISLLAWSDWFTLIILIIFVVRGFIQGLAKEIISLVFVILAIILAFLYYDEFTNTFLSSWISSTNQSIFALSFGTIFLGIWFIKKGFYRIAESSSRIDNPCDLNRPFAISIITTIIAITSYNYLGIISELRTIEVMIVNESLRNFVSFCVVFAAFLTATIALSKLLNIKIDNEEPCVMAPVFSGFLRVFSTLDVLINARNIVGLKNKFFGAVLGLFKGGIFVLIIVLILQSMTWVTQNHAWVETSGALRTFQDWSVDIKPLLSKYLLFVELEPGDAVAEFIETEILGE